MNMDKSTHRIKQIPTHTLRSTVSGVSISMYWTKINADAHRTCTLGFAWSFLLSAPTPAHCVGWYWFCYVHNDHPVLWRAAHRTFSWWLCAPVTILTPSFRFQWSELISLRKCERWKYLFLSASHFFTNFLNPSRIRYFMRSKQLNWTQQLHVKCQ